MDGLEADHDAGVSAEWLFLELAELPDDERASRLAAMAAPLRASVESLLAGLEAGAWLEEPLCDPRRTVGGLLAEGLEDAREDAEPAAPASIGRYRIRRELGRGGHAVVYLALETGDLRRWVALKRLLDGGPSALARFEAERRTLATLEHRGVPRIFDSGLDGEGRPWFSMELVRGDWITRWCRERTLPPRRRIELFREALDAVRSAHAAGVVHRDLKPSNIMVGEHGGRPDVKVIDFGIARGSGLSGSQATATDAPGLLGSLSTMSPEQVRGGAAAATGRSDVYALGAILFELLAERPARSLRDRALGEVVREIAEGESPRLGTVAPGCRGDLDAIVGKAMSFDPRDRYATAGEFDEDLARFLAGEPAAARVPGRLERAVRWGRRHRRPLAGAALVLVAIGALATFERQRSARMSGMREAGRLASLLGEEERLRRERGSEPERRRLLAEVLAATAAGSDTGLAREERASLRARALVAECEPDLRPEPDAAAPSLLSEAVELRRLEVAARPEDPAALEGLSLALVRRGDSDPAKREAALRDYLEARSIDERLHREHPAIRRFHDNLVWSHDRIGTALFNLGRGSESRAAFRAMVEEAGRLLVAHPEPAVTRHTVGFARYLHGCLLAGDGAADEAAVELEAAIGEMEEAIRRDPQRIDFHLSREQAGAVLAALEIARGRLAEAVEICDRSRDSSQYLSAFAPERPLEHRFPAVDARLLLGEEAFAVGDFARASRLAAEAERIAVEEFNPRSRLPMPFLAPRLELLRGKVRPLELALDTAAPDDPARWPPPVAAAALVDLLACARVLSAAEPDLADRCRRAADGLVVGLADIAPDHAAYDEMRARRAVDEGRVEDAIRLLESSNGARGGRFDPTRLVVRGSLLAAVRERAAGEGR